MSSLENATMNIRNGVRTFAAGSHTYFNSPNEIMSEMIEGENAVEAVADFEHTQNIQQQQDVAMQQHVVEFKRIEQTVPIQQLEQVVAMQDQTNNSTSIIEVLRAPGNAFHMQRVNFLLQKVLRLFPPAKNENKFIYGKLAEKVIIDNINLCDGLSAVDLDSNHTTGSEYKNDVGITHDNTSTTHNYSIKVSKSGGKITLINCRNTDNHNIDGLSMIVGHIKRECIYIFDHGPEFEKFKSADGASVDYKSSIFTYLKKRPQYTVQLPPLSEEQKEILEGINEVEPYDYLYNQFIANLDTTA